GFEVDGGSIVDANCLDNADLIHAGDALIIPGAKRLHPKRRVSEEPSTTAQSSGQAEAQPADSEVAAQPAAAPAAPPHVVGGGSAVVQNAMAHLGQPYVWGGVGPRGFDCSGFVYYILRVSGHPVSRGLWGQLNGGPRIGRGDLEPGDTVFFANTYEP